MATETDTQIQSLGGLARAKKLTSEQRSDIARAAAEARWMADGLPRATHDGDLDLAGRIIKAAVLSNGQRLLTQGTLLLAIGRSRTPKAGTGGYSTVDELPFFLQAEQLKPFISDDLRMSTTPIFFRLKNGQKAVGYDAKLLPMVCEVYLQLRDTCLEERRDIPRQYKHIVKACDLLMRGLANVGIIALVDEATGYQEVRDRQALQEVLRHYIDGKLYEWTLTFPMEFFKGIFRLKGWNWNAGKMPQVVGKYVKDLVYQRLAPGVLAELKRLNPPTEKGYKKHRNHQFLTRDLGHPSLTRMLYEQIGMQSALDDGEWDRYRRIVDRRFPKFNDTIPLPLND
jgi:hypothetical protein